MKKCSFCAEEIDDQAIKCRFCGSELVKKGNERWYSKTSLLVIALLCVGPLALPLLWFNPRFKNSSKIIITIIVIILSYFLAIEAAKSLKTLTQYYRQMSVPNF